jgi:hypothetical protein
MRRLRVLSFFAALPCVALSFCDSGSTSAPLPTYEASTADSGTFAFIDSGVDAAADAAPDTGKKDSGHDAGHDTGAAIDAHTADVEHLDSGTDAAHDSGSTHDAGVDSPFDAMKDASHE